MKAVEVKATNETIDQIGIPKEIKRAIVEYIWNGFDAGASEVSINYKIQKEIDHVESFSIQDNGKGIAFEELNKTFTPILDSQKKNFHTSFYTKGKKGKGRFSFISLCTQVEWETIYENGGEKFQYSIKIAKASKNKYLPSELKKIDSNIETGTITKFNNLLSSINKDFLESDEFISFLKFEFAWFLHLHKEQKFKILINGFEIEYNDVISETDESNLVIKHKDKDRKYSFNINYIQWRNKIGEDSQNYYLDENKKPKWNEDNKTNNKGDNFYNSIYVVSKYFNSFDVVDKKEEKQQGLPSQNTDKYDYVFKELNKEIIKILKEKRKSFLLNQGNLLIGRLYEQNVMPSFGAGKYEKLKKEDFEEVVKEIYIFEPQIFEKNNNSIQKKTILAFLKELLNDSKRDHLLKILENILELEEEQIKELSETIKKVELKGIIKLTNLIIERKEVIDILNFLVTDLSRFTNERDHIQKIIENNYWIFGEQFTSVTNDKNFKKLEETYIKILGLESSKINSTSKRRPDIFIVKNRGIPTHNTKFYKTEHVIVELKRPSQSIGTEQFRQIEDYMEEIKNNSTFSGELDEWKFIIIGNELETFVKDKYESFNEYDDPFLVGESRGKYRIYAYTWNDIFSMFENTHQHLIDGLEIDDEELKFRLSLKGSNGKDLPDSLTKYVTN